MKVGGMGNKQTVLKSATALPVKLWRRLKRVRRGNEEVLNRIAELECSLSQQNMLLEQLIIERCPAPGEMGEWESPSAGSMKTEEQPRGKFDDAR